MVNWSEARGFTTLSREIDEFEQMNGMSDDACGTRRRARSSRDLGELIALCLSDRSQRLRIAVLSARAKRVRSPQSITEETAMLSDIAENIDMNRDSIIWFPSLVNPLPLQ